MQDAQQTAEITGGSETGALEALSAVASEVVETLPQGIVLLNSSRQFQVANPAGYDFIGDSHPGSTCCEMFGCRREGTPLEDVCLTEEALARGESLPEIRIDLPVDDPTDAAWVTAAPLSTADGVVLHLRPGTLTDRRRRTDPDWLGPQRLFVCALGRTSVKSGAVSLDGGWLDQRPGQVFKFLVCERNRVASSEEIAEAIWPMADPGNAVGRVRHYIHTVRDRLEPEREKHSSSPTFVLSKGGGYTLDHTRVAVDVDLFETHAAAGLNAFDRQEFEAADQDLERANTLYRGDLLADEPLADWAFGERERLHELACAVVRSLAAIDLRRGNLDRAATHLARLGALQPFDVDTHRQAIVLSLRRGRKTEAMRRFSTLRARLRRQFGEELSFTIADLAEEAQRAPQFS